MTHRDQLAEHLKFAAEMGIEGITRDPVWRARVEPDTPVPGTRAEAIQGTTMQASTAQVEATIRAALPIDAAVPVVVARSPAEALALLRAEIGPQCTRCKLGTLGRKQVVFGEGDPSAGLMFVGEGPGADEDEQGVPFIGRAGQLLTKIIEAINLTREQVYIANVVKCRPPQNRNPEPDEIATCEPFLFQQLDLIRPKVVVALGKFAAQTLLRTEEPISKLRGRIFDYRGDAKLIPTFHPAYLLRNPSSKREVWEDMKLVARLLGS
jgi:uracil-DNA glycosylase family 4